MKKIICLSILMLVIFTTTCFAKTDVARIYNEEKTIKLEQVKEYEDSIEKEIVRDNVKYQLKDIKKKENKVILKQDKNIKEEKVVKMNDKYKVLNLFDSKKKIEEDGFSGSLTLKNSSLSIKVKDSHIEQYKVTFKQEYTNVASNELNDVPKTIEKDGITYFLTDPNWTVAQVQKVDGKEIPIAYNGIMNYEGVKEKRVITSYLATVEYEGTLEKETTEYITFNMEYEELPKQAIDYKPILASTFGVFIFSGIIILKKKNIRVYNLQNGQWKLVKKLHISKNNKLIDITPLMPMTSKYKIKMSNKIFNELLNTNVTIKYFDKKYIYEVKEQEFEIFA